MEKFTIPSVRKYINEKYGEPRHDIKSLVLACRKLAKKEKIDARDLFYLLIENKPIAGEDTHSYGFHTRRGRYLINTSVFYYNEIKDND